MLRNYMNYDSSSTLYMASNKVLTPCLICLQNHSHFFKSGENSASLEYHIWILDFLHYRSGGTFWTESNS